MHASANHCVPAIAPFLSGLGGGRKYINMLACIQESGDTASNRSAVRGGQQQLPAKSKLWPGLPADGLQALRTAADVVSSRDYVEWLPSFGCAVLALGQLPPTRGIDSAGAPSFDQKKYFATGSESLRSWQYSHNTVLMLLHASR
eukprot:1155977-Pelagomonas_calceolata.AAC.3